VIARRSLALVTGDVPVDHDQDRPILDQLLADRAVPATWVRWDDPSVDWSSFGAAMIRSTWDYTARHAEFLAWARRVAGQTELWNPAPVVTWNSHKAYLLELAEAGVAVVSTVLVAAGDPLDLVEVMARHGWDEVVVKPAVSAGAVGAERVARDRAAHWTAVDQAARGQRTAPDRLVQPMVVEVAEGEVSLVAVEGQVTHAVRKIPAPGDFRVHAHLGGTERVHSPSAAELALAQAALDVVDQPLLYARIDCVPTPEGPLLMELELIEPSLFLPLAPPEAGAALADAVAARL
jgi:glutathione synthase/RimK-type ligase-like ATP-grasp enzyme